MKRAEQIINAVSSLEVSWEGFLRCKSAGYEYSMVEYYGKCVGQLSLLMFLGFMSKSVNDKLYDMTLEIKYGEFDSDEIYSYDELFKRILRKGVN